MHVKEVSLWKTFCWNDCDVPKNCGEIQTTQLQKPYTHIYLSIYNITNEFLLLEMKREQRKICDLFHLQHYLLTTVHFHSSHYDRLPVWPHYLTLKFFNAVNNNTPVKSNCNLSIFLVKFKILRNSVSILTHPIF